MPVTVTVATLRHEYARQRVLGIGEPRPRLSWEITTDISGWLQTAYELEGRRYLQWPSFRGE